MICVECGYRLEAGARFCSSCGNRIRDDSVDSTSIFQAVTDTPEAEPLEPHMLSELAPGNALLFVSKGAGDELRFLIDTDVTFIGRHPESDVFLDDVTVSRHHAKLVRVAGRIYLEDLGSLNGTYLNRTLIEERAQLTSGDEIQIGKYRATINMGEFG